MTMKSFLSTIPAGLAIALLMAAPALGLFSYRLLHEFAAVQGLASGPGLEVAVVIGAVWEVALLLLVAKDLIKE